MVSKKATEVFDLSRFSILFNIVIVLMGGSLVWGAQRNDVNNLKERFAQAQEDNRDSVNSLRRDIHSLRSQQQSQYQEIMSLLININNDRDQ